MPRSLCVHDWSIPAISCKSENPIKELHAIALFYEGIQPCINYGL